MFSFEQLMVSLLLVLFYMTNDQLTSAPRQLNMDYRILFKNK